MLGSRVPRLSSLLSVSFFLALARPALGQAVGDSKPGYLSSVEGLYRISIAGSDSLTVRETRYLRLLPAGIGRLEVVRIRNAAGRLTAHVDLLPLERVWHTRTATSSGSAQLCLRLDGDARCLWIRREMPRGDLLLYHEGDELGSPTLVLTRYDAVKVARR